MPASSVGCCKRSRQQWHERPDHHGSRKELWLILAAVLSICCGSQLSLLASLWSMLPLLQMGKLLWVFFRFLPVLRPQVRQNTHRIALCC